MIDHDAAAELWDRYNRGERNVYAQAHCVHWLVLVSGPAPAGRSAFRSCGVCRPRARGIAALAPSALARCGGRVST